MPFGLCNILATFQRLIQNCTGELNLIYCLIYRDDIIIFSSMAEEHFHHLHITFDQFREHNLKLKPSKCNFFRNKITYLAQWVSKDGVHPSDLNMKAITECALPQTYTEVCVFLGLVGHYRRFINGFACITQPLSKYLAREGANRKSEWVSLTEEAMKAFEAFKQVCMTAPILMFADYTKLFIGDWCIQRWIMNCVVTEASRQAVPQKYHCTKLQFLELKWAVTEHFKEYLPYQSFVMRTDNNLFTHIMSTPNLDDTCHWWVSVLAQFNFELEY